MLVKMKRSLFEGLADRTLVWACIEPTIVKIRGKGPDVKAGVYAGLTAGQQALMLFQVFYGHTRSAGEFYWFACHYMSQPSIWNQMKEGLYSYGCEQLLGAFEEMEKGLEPRLMQAAADGKGISVMDLERDPALLASVNHMYEMYRTAANDAVSRIAAHIRSNSKEYIQFDA